MENLKLTVEIAAAYPNAFVKTENFICRQVGITFDTQEFILKATGGVIADLFVAPVSDCQLLLTPLSEISDEDAIELVNVVMKIYSDYDDEWKVNCGKAAAKFMTHPYGPLRPDYSRELIDFLRSKSYDCGYGSIPSLIESGIATKK